MGNTTATDRHMDSPQNYLSVDQFSALTGLSVSTVRRRIRDGSLPVFQLGQKRRVLIPSTALTTRTHPAPAATPPVPPAPAEPPPDTPTLAGPRPRWTRPTTR